MESVTQAVSNLALQFGEEDADPGAMVSYSSHPFVEFTHSNPKSSGNIFLRTVQIDDARQEA